MTNLNFIEDILSKSIISRTEIIGDVLFVDSNPAKIEIINTIINNIYIYIIHKFIFTYKTKQ